MTPRSSASCFEIVLLFAVRAGVVDQTWANKQYAYINRKIKNKRFGKVTFWIKAWLHVLAGKNRTNYVRALTGNPRDDNQLLEAEILSFYGRGSKKNTLVERDTVEHMLDEHSMIRRGPVEGPDRQVFFAPPPWSR